ncbi:NYN domain-containing protein [Natronocalculus amylovorans]|uniref:NYN domain-containing protein n=1 Tax=Natronocalculus amylovorans TaxID=2917812 RepID=A0AAE3FX59_9EURY|nr:NYN domain-containing protein [Natronocalculus amylovorans]MCL9816319.1 NYN domain-containing protein [Natronocalculus amylovorans]
MDVDHDGQPNRTGVALFVDGPNILRDEFDVDLDDVREAAKARGHLVTTRLYVDEHATPGLIQAAEARGYEVIVTSGDVDVKLAVDATEIALSGNTSMLAIASRDTDFKPLLEIANAHGIKTFAIAPGAHGRSDALQNAATHAVTLEETRQESTTTNRSDTASEPSAAE